MIYNDPSANENEMNRGPAAIRWSIIIILFLIPVTQICSQVNWKHGRLTISANGHFLQFEDGTPFFWLGDTAWELFHRLKKEEIATYLQNRHQKGMNLIQAVIIANTDNPLSPNQYGDRPLLEEDPEKPNENYFKLVDWVVEEANKKGMFMGLLPTWGGKVSKFWAKGNVLFNERNAYSYGLFLGRRYKDYQNIVWITGGDRPAVHDTADWRPVWEAMIKGLREGSNGKALITYHPWGEHSSTEYWRNTAVLDFNMLQSGHARRDIEVWRWIERDYHIQPPKPILDGEPTYEDHPINWKLENGYFRDYDVRKQLYRSVFSGACGVTYGHQAIWQFYSARENKIVFPDRTWMEALDRPGAFHAAHLKRLIESRPSLNRVADQSIIKTGQGEKENFITAFRDTDNSYAMIYLPVGKKIAVNLSWMKSVKVRAWWFNPRTAEVYKLKVFRNKDGIEFVPPTQGPDNDWVLVLDDAGKKRNAPASANNNK